MNGDTFTKEKRQPIIKFLAPLGEGYRVGNVVYLYTTRAIAQDSVNDQVHRYMEIPGTTTVFNQTEKLRIWAKSYNISVPMDTEGLYNYVLTIGDQEPLPTVWPSHAYMQHHRTLSSREVESFTPTVVFPSGNQTMCRFGHTKTVVPRTKSTAKPRYNCHRCAYWREKNIDLDAYLPTHCMNGHSLIGNRYLTVGRTIKDGVVKEHCVQCNNKEIIDKYGYKPYEG